MKVITIDKRSFKEKFNSLKWEAKQKANKAIDWCIRNKDGIMYVAPTVISGVVVLAKVFNKHATVKKQEQLKDLYCYDRSLGHYWKLRRELSNAEWIEIDRRKKAGERLADILDELKVLK